MSYFDKQVNDAMDQLNKFGDAEAFITVSQPSESEAREVSHHIPDQPGTVTFEVERKIVMTDLGERVANDFWIGVFSPGDILRVERRTITITTTEWRPVG